jgi:hypothetical protein
VLESQKCSMRQQQAEAEDEKQFQVGAHAFLVCHIWFFQLYLPSHQPYFLNLTAATAATRTGELFNRTTAPLLSSYTYVIKTPQTLQPYSSCLRTQRRCVNRYS